jgi:hypothetical protein
MVDRNAIGKLSLCQQQPTMKKPHDDDYSKQERKLLLVGASMMQAYAGVFGELHLGCTCSCCRQSIAFNESTDYGKIHPFTGIDLLPQDGSIICCVPP